MELKATNYRVDGHVATVELSRPERRNAWTGRMHAEYRWCCAEAERDPQVRVIVVQGDPKGSTFCVGADTEALAGHVTRGGYDSGLPEAEALANPGASTHPFLDAHFAWQLGLRKPIVANINGACAGVGLALVAFCDIRFVSAKAILTTAAPKLGLPAEYGTSWILPRIMNRMVAIDLLLSGRRFSGVEAERWGFALRAYEENEAATCAQTYAHELATTTAPSSLTMTKRQIAIDLLRHDVAASVHEADELLAKAMTGPEFAEGVAALRERRPPNFR